MWVGSNARDWNYSDNNVMTVGNQNIQIIETRFLSSRWKTPSIFSTNSLGEKELKYLQIIQC